MNYEELAIEKLLQSEDTEKFLGKLVQCNDLDFICRILSINPFPVHFNLKSLSFYKIPENVNEWKRCPKCGFKPLVWSFDNGEFTACACYETEYKSFSIRAESVNSYYKNHGTLEDYNLNGLRDNWNSYCEGNLKEVFEVVKDKNGNILKW